MLSYFRKPTPNDLMIQELANAQCALLQAQSGLEWATSQVAYNKARVARLKADLALNQPNLHRTLGTGQPAYPGPQPA